MTNVVVRGRSGLAQTVTAREHTLVADEPVPDGGADSGPTPYELLLGALGACTAMTVRMYAARHNWPLEDVEVQLQHERVHVEDCRTCDTQPVQLERITKSITFYGPLDAAQRQRLLEIAARCPVHRTLTSHVEIQQQELVLSD